MGEGREWVPENEIRGNKTRRFRCRVSQKKGAVDSLNLCCFVRLDQKEEEERVESVEKMCPVFFKNAARRTVGSTSLFHRPFTF